MKKLFLMILVFCSTSFLFAEGNKPDKETNPDDTLKMYYLNEVVIHSSVKETNDLKNMPTAVSIVSPLQLQDARIESLPQLSAYIPNFFVPSYGSKVSTPIYIRGVGARLGAQTVSLYTDNVPSFNPSAFDFEFQDIQRIEVLRGAQGTLYGRNAIGGIVNIYTLSPLTFQGTKLMVGGGNYGQFSVSASDYRKLSDRFGLSAAGYYKRDDGYFTNKYTGKRVDDSENAGGRVKLEWQASPSFKALLFANYDYVSGGAFPYMHVDSTNVSFNEPSSYDRHLFTNGLSLEYSGKGYSIHSTTGFQFMKDDMKMDQDYTPKSVFSINQKQTQRSVSQEITVKSNTEGNYRWVVGAFGFLDNRKIDTTVELKEDAVATFDSYFKFVNENPDIPVTLGFVSNQIDMPGVYNKPSKGAALFHQSTLNDLFGLEGFSATAGIRFDYEDTSIDFLTESNGGDVNLDFQLPGPPRPTVLIEGDTLLQGKYSKNFWNVLPKFALKYQMSPKSQIYLSASKGYKTGGYNEQAFSRILRNALMESVMRNVFARIPKGIPGIPDMGSSAGSGSDTSAPSLEEQLSYDSETSWTYELGGRYEIFDRSLSLSYALFYTNVDNIQIIKLEEQGTSGRTVKNAGKSDSKGFELSLKYLPLENLSFFADYGFADARFTNYRVESEDDEEDKIDYSGNHIPFAPQHTLSLGASYVHHFAYGSFIDRLRGNIQYKGVGKIYWTESNKDNSGENALYQPFYGITNASVSAEKGAFSLECWVENLFNTKYNSFLFEAEDMTTGDVNAFAQRGYPTRFGATLRYTLNR